MYSGHRSGWPIRWARSPQGNPGPGSEPRLAGTNCRAAPPQGMLVRRPELPANTSGGQQRPQNALSLWRRDWAEERGARSASLRGERASSFSPTCPWAGLVPAAQEAGGLFLPPSLSPARTSVSVSLPLHPRFLICVSPLSHPKSHPMTKVCSSKLSPLNLGYRCLLSLS